MNWEKFTHPLIVVAAIGGIALWVRKSPGGAIPTPLVNGGDPGRWMGEGAGVGAASLYVAGVPDYAQDPGYIASAAANPYAQDPEADTSVTGTLSDTGGSIAPYLTYNTMGGANPYAYLNQPAEGGCGCGGGCGGCAPKCASDCDSGVRFADGRGSCMVSEAMVPDAFNPVNMWFGYGTPYIPENISA